MKYKKIIPYEDIRYSLEKMKNELNNHYNIMDELRQFISNHSDLINKINKIGLLKEEIFKNNELIKIKDNVKKLLNNINYDIIINKRNEFNNILDDNLNVNININIEESQINIEKLVLSKTIEEVLEDLNNNVILFNDDISKRDAEITQYIISVLIQKINSYNVLVETLKELKIKEGYSNITINYRGISIDI